MARPNNDQVHLRLLRDHFARERCLPSYEDMAAMLGFKAKNAAFQLVQRLVTSGHLAKSSGGRPVPGPGFFKLKLSVDEVKAGLDADRSSSGWLNEQSLNDLLVAHPSKTILVPVRGESMVSVGILSGDVAVVEVGAQAVNGDFVVAEIDDAHTLKEFRQVGTQGQLFSHGNESTPIVPSRSLNIIGVVRGIVRSYKPRPRAATKLSRQGARQ